MPMMILLAEDRVGKDLKLTVWSGLVDLTLEGSQAPITVAHLPAPPVATGESKNNKSKKPAGFEIKGL